MSPLQRSQASTLVLPRDPRTVEASQRLASFAEHAQMQAVAEWSDAHQVARPALACTDEDIAACLATLGGSL